MSSDPPKAGAENAHIAEWLMRSTTACGRCVAIRDPDADAVARIGLESRAAGRVAMIPGMIDKPSIGSPCLVAERMIASMAGWMMAKLVQDFLLLFRDPVHAGPRVGSRRRHDLTIRRHCCPARNCISRTGALCAGQ